jgi:26S proteasome regulatory subunit N5
LCRYAWVQHAEGYFEATDPTIPAVPELKLRYYHLMIRFYSHSNEYLEMCRCYQNIMECEGVKEDAAKWTPILKKVVWFVALAPNEPMQQSLLHQISKDGKLADLPLHKQLMKQFTTKVGGLYNLKSVAPYRASAILSAKFSTLKTRRDNLAKRLVWW